MGYDLHSTRADGWLDSTAYPMDLRTWIEVASAAPELERASELSDGSMNPVFVIGDGRQDAPAFFWTDRRVVGRGADEGDVRVGVIVAGRLAANVAGDDDEHQT